MRSRPQKERDPKAIAHTAHDPRPSASVPGDRRGVLFSFFKGRPAGLKSTAAEMTNSAVAKLTPVAEKREALLLFVPLLLLDHHVLAVRSFRRKINHVMTPSGNV